MHFERAVQYGDKLPTFGVNDGTGRSFAAVQRAFPGKLRSLIAMEASLCARAWKQAIAIEQEIARQVGVHKGEIRQHEYLGIVENMPAIAKTSQALGGNAVMAVMRRVADAQLVEVVTYSKLRLIIALDNHVRNVT